MITTELTSLKHPEGVEQAKALGEWIRTHQISLDAIVSSKATAAEETASIALGRKVDVFDNNWREIDLGSFEGKNPREIKEDFKKYHPGKEVPNDANECFYYPWLELDGEQRKVFEPLKTVFKERILKAFKDLETTYKGKTVAVFTHCEPMREAVLSSKGTENFFLTKFGQNIAKLLPQSSRENTLDTAITLPMFKPEYASAIKFQIKDGQIYIDDAFKITFRG